MNGDWEDVEVMQVALCISPLAYLRFFFLSIQDLYTID